MRTPKKTAALFSAAILIGSAGAVAFADDGDRVSKSMSHEGKTTGNDVPENEHAFIQMMNFYVPIQQANGEPALGEYYDVDEAYVETRTAAKPLVGVYINGEVEHVDGVGFSGYGLRDAYGAISLDDGMTWKNTNLSESADETSSDVIRDDIKLFKDTKGEYPGDVVNIFHAVAGNKVVVAWPSKFCSSGQPNYSLDAADDPLTPDVVEGAEAKARRLAIAAYLGIDFTTASADDLYLIDMFRVAGQQGSVDYAEDKWEQNHVVGEVPYSCVWTARGQLVNGDDPRTEAAEASFMRWFKPERLTSGRRDANRIEVKAVEGAGFAITWQEDPDGLRPGQGEGPGEGWSGAIANSGTDIWYSYLDWEDFDVVQDPFDETETGVIPIGLVDAITVPEFATTETYELNRATVADITQKPKPFVPFAMPMPLTDNAKCNIEPQGEDGQGTLPPYCYGAGAAALDIEMPRDEQLDIDLDPFDFGMKDMCADTVEIATGKGGHDADPDAEPVLSKVCVPASGTPLVGNTASTRARINLFGYDTGTNGLSAFVVMQAEEDKGLGRATYNDLNADGIPDGTTLADQCEPEQGDRTCIAWDKGKDQRYHTFSFSLSDPMADHAIDGLLANLTFTGHMLNQPEVSWVTGDFYPTLNTSEIWNFGTDYNYDLHNTEIARRGSLLAQGISNVGAEGLLALPTWKQGQMNQGGPADVMSRRIELPAGDWSVPTENPYAFRNMECGVDDLGERLYSGVDDANPYYPGGLCMAPAINMSATVPDAAIDSSDAGLFGNLPELTLLDGAEYYSSDTNPILRGLAQNEGNTTKILTWHQEPFAAAVKSSSVPDLPAEPGSEPVLSDRGTTFADQSWYNPYEVAKGHRGFLDGDFVMMLYAWSPNWRLNTVGHDRYELYIRRSFSGGLDWTTTPASYDGDGTVSCETYRSDQTQAAGELEEPEACYEYADDAPEQARNVTQHSSMRTTTLDPRYAKTPASITENPYGLGPQGYTSGGDSEDVRDPSRFFIVYETGDNTTTAEGEPEPLDLFYSRAVNYGDDYQVWAEDDYQLSSEAECYPSYPHDDVKLSVIPIGSGFCNEFDQLEQGKPGLEASEASLAANPGGEFLYAAWAQMLFDDSKVKDDKDKKKDKTEFVESDAMVRRVWWIDDYISDTEAWDFGQGPDGGTTP